MMHLNALSKYRSFCTAAPADFPVFMQSWYLDAVCEDGHWDIVLVEEAGKIVGVWPFFVKKKWHWSYVAMPQLGKLMGPYLVPEARNLKAETRILQALIAQLPPEITDLEQDCNYTLVNWLPLYWAGFKQTTRYSYRMDLTQSLDALWQGMESDYRRKIKKAESSLEIRHDLGIEELFQTGAESFARQGLDVPFPFAYFQKIYDALHEHQACQAFFAVDRATQEVYSSGLLVWDQHAAYALWGGDNPAFRSSGSGVLMLWERIKYTKEVLHLPVFDFMGSMMPNVEPGRRYFGAYQQPYFRISKQWSPVLKWIRLIQNHW